MLFSFEDLDFPWHLFHFLPDVELKCLVLRYLNDFKFYTLSDLYLICRCMNRDKRELYCNKIVTKI